MSRRCPCESRPCHPNVFASARRCRTARQWYADIHLRLFPRPLVHKTLEQDWQRAESAATNHCRSWFVSSLEANSIIDHTKHFVLNHPHLGVVIRVFFLDQLLADQFPMISCSLYWHQYIKLGQPFTKLHR